MKVASFTRSDVGRTELPGGDVRRTPRADPATTLTDGDRSPPGTLARMDAPETIICVDCGGTCHLLTVIDSEDQREGDVAVYRCEDCLDRWDMVMSDDD